jgi:hypothetical protein
LPLLAVVMLVGCRAAGPTVVNDAALTDESEGNNWLAFGRSHRGMPQFAEFTDRRLGDLRHFIRQQAELGLQAVRR